MVIVDDRLPRRFPDTLKGIGWGEVAEVVSGQFVMSVLSADGETYLIDPETGREVIAVNPSTPCRRVKCKLVIMEG